jgi:L-threonylcarbamoyladenylate synthase
MARIVTANNETLEQAGAALRAGQLVVIPTETVYGLGANAWDGQAVAKIFAAKGRPSFNPLIVHAADVDTALALAEPNHVARQLAHQFWPGPLTIIMNMGSESKISDLCTAGLGTVAVRVPAHPVAQAIIRAAGVPVAAPSANRSGTISPTTAQHVAESLGDNIDLIVAAGSCAVGLESTVIDTTGDVPLILRPGVITAEDISAFLGYEVGIDLGDHAAPKSPGQILRHYAPHIPIRLNAVDVKPNEALLAFGSLKFMGIVGGGFAKTLPDHQLKNLSETGDLYEAAANLFRMMRLLDQSEFDGIAVMSVPQQGLGIAINDRLRRAAATHDVDPSKA